MLDWSLFLLGDPKVVAVSASTYDLLATNGFGAGSSGGYKGKTGAGDGDARTFDVEDLASVFMRLADGGTLLVEASWAAHRRDGDEFGITLYGTDGGAELIVDDYAPRATCSSSPTTTARPSPRRVPVKRGRAHKAVIEQFVDKIRAGDWRRLRRLGRRRPRPRRRRLLPLGRRAARDPPRFLGRRPPDLGPEPRQRGRGGLGGLFGHVDCRPLSSTRRAGGPPSPATGGERVAAGAVQVSSRVGPEHLHRAAHAPAGGAIGLVMLPSIPTPAR